MAELLPSQLGTTLLTTQMTHLLAAQLHTSHAAHTNLQVRAADIRMLLCPTWVLLQNQGQIY